MPGCSMPWEGQATAYTPVIRKDSLGGKSKRKQLLPLHLPRDNEVNTFNHIIIFTVYYLSPPTEHKLHESREFYFFSLMHP